MGSDWIISLIQTCCCPFKVRHLRSMQLQTYPAIIHVVVLPSLSFSAQEIKRGTLLSPLRSSVRSLHCKHKKSRVCMNFDHGRCKVRPEKIQTCCRKKRQVEEGPGTARKKITFPDREKNEKKTEIERSGIRFFIELKKLPEGLCDVY